MPATVAQCSNCFYCRTKGTAYSCHRHAPIPTNQGGIIWPTIAAGDWCGEGWDSVNGSYGSPPHAGVINP